MKHLMKFSLLACSLMLSTTTFAGHGDTRQEHHERMAGRGVHGAPSLLEHFGKILRELDLDVSQKESIHAIMQDSKEDLKANHEAALTARQQLHEVLTADALDEEALAGVARLEGDIAAERVMITGAVASRVLAELNDAQRAELRSMGEQRRQHLREKRERKDS